MKVMELLSLLKTELTKAQFLVYNYKNEDGIGCLDLTFIEA